ncbi:MAG: HEAT repeat domain-containing protein [Sandaracinaceae bacterium]|nr:HEAT repeat domain-containing protein [Sandaracinaceae bacterium]
MRWQWAIILVVILAGADRARAQAEPSLEVTDTAELTRNIEVLARRGDRASVARIAARVEAGLPSPILLRAVDALAEHAAEPSYALLVRLAQHRRPAVRARVARALGASRNAGARNVLADLLDDPDADVRAQAALALGAVGAQPVLETVLLAALHGVAEAAIVLGQQAAAAHVARIVRRLEPATLEALAPALRILLERANVPRPSKSAIVERLGTLGGGAERLLREVQATLGPGDALRGSIDSALARLAEATP